jgi:two-component system nitrate/nitrite response regulator NarL
VRKETATVNLQTVKNPIENHINGFHEAAEPGQNVRILIAEGHQVMREGLRRLLSAEKGFTVIGEATDPDSLCQIMERNCPDVLLVSSMLGGSSDTALLQRLKAGTCASRIIVMTSSTRREDHVRAIRFGASGIMTHDTSSAMLALGIRKVHEGELWADRKVAADAIRQMLATRASAPPIRAGSDYGKAVTLSKREKEVAALVAQGFKNKDIADSLFISEQTVKNHMHNIFEKLGVSDRLELALVAFHHGLAG